MFAHLVGEFGLSFCRLLTLLLLRLLVELLLYLRSPSNPLCSRLLIIVSLVSPCLMKMKLLLPYRNLGLSFTCLLRRRLMSLWCFLRMIRLLWSLSLLFLLLPHPWCLHLIVGFPLVDWIQYQPLSQLYRLVSLSVGVSRVSLLP